VYVERNVEVRSRNHCCHGKAMRITHSERVFVALVIQHAKPIRVVVFPFVASPAIQQSSTLSRKRRDFLGKKSY